MLIEREAPGLGVAIHVRNILPYCLLVQSQPHAIIIVDLGEKKANRLAFCKHLPANETDREQSATVGRGGSRDSGSVLEDKLRT